MDSSDHVEKKSYVLWLLNYPISHFPHKNHLPKNHPQKSFKMLESKVMMRASGTHIKTKIGAKLWIHLITSRRNLTSCVAMHIYTHDVFIVGRAQEIYSGTETSSLIDVKIWYVTHHNPFYVWYKFHVIFSSENECTWADVTSLHAHISHHLSKIHKPRNVSQSISKNIRESESEREERE